MKMVMEGLQEDIGGEGNLQCRDHPYRNNKNTPAGGICAFCLQEKLGKLVSSSSSFPIAIFPSPSSSPPESFRSGYGGSTSTLSVRPNPSASSSSSTNTINVINHHPNGNIMPFLPSHKKKKKKKKDLALASATEQASSNVFRRSKSTATPRRGMHFTEADEGEEDGPRKRGFWSFLYLSKHSNNRKIDKQQGSKDISYASSNGSFSQRSTKKREDFPAVDENESPDDQAAFDRKVSRSRSVGCGSRSFSGPGDFFERISTGFGDCTLRRVESQREGKPKVTPIHRRGGGGGQDCIRERVKCGGIFSGFMITSSSSSSSSSSYWVSSSAEDNNMNGKVAAAARQPGHGRSKSWGWAFASPIRAFSKPSSGKREVSKNTTTTTTTPNLNAIPSLLAVRG